jgi:hypothetical protein
VRTCFRCRGPVEGSFRYCPWCAAPQRLKLVELFRAHPELDAGKALRVSRYLGRRGEPRHVRLSIWVDDSPDRAQARAAVSLDDAEALRLASFLVASDPTPRRPHGLRALIGSSLRGKGLARGPAVRRP